MIFITCPRADEGGKWSVSLGFGSANVSDALDNAAVTQVEDRDRSLHLSLGYSVSEQLTVGLDYIDLGNAEARLEGITTDPEEFHIAQQDTVPLWVLVSL